MFPHLDLIQLLKTVGYFGIFGIIFAESGLLFGFFLPGDSLLFTAGFLASQGFFNIAVLCSLTFIASVTGDSVGYTFGRRVGRRLFRKDESVFFHKDHLVRAQAFYEKHGGKTIVLARFMPFVRTFAPIVAGIGLMKYPKFLAYNIVGGFLWAVCIPVAGYFLGNLIPDVDRYLLPIIAGIIFVSVLPSALSILRDKPTRTRLLQFLFSSIRR